MDLYLLNKVLQISGESLVSWRMGLGRNMPHMTVQKGGNRFNQIFSTWWLTPVVLSHCSELPWENSELSCASRAVLFSATANTHISSSFSPRGFYPALTLKWCIKTLAAFYWDCTDTTKDVSCFGESWVQSEMVCTWAMMNSWRFLLLFPPFCLIVESVRPHQAQLESPKSIFCCAGATKCKWGDTGSGKSSTFLLPSTQISPFDPSSAFSSTPAWTSSTISCTLGAGVVPGAAGARRPLRLRLSLLLPSLGWWGEALEQSVTQHSCCCSLFRGSSPSHPAPLLIPVSPLLGTARPLLAGGQCLGKLWWPFRTQQ